MANRTKKSGRITDVSIHELSPIFENHKGEKWHQANPHAVFLTVKGGTKDGVKVEGAKPFLTKLAETFKSIFGPVSIDVADNIDNDGDGADDYNLISSLISDLYWNISSCWGISDDEARAAGVTTAIDNFLESLDELRGTQKGGARHNAADKKALAAIADAHAAIGSNLESLGVAVVKAEPIAAEPAAAEGGATPETKGEEIVVDLSAPAAPVAAVEPGNVADAIAKAVADATAAFEQKLADAKAAAATETAALIETAVATAKAASDQTIATLQASLDQANSSLATVAKGAATPSSPGFVPTRNEDGVTVDPGDPDGSQRKAAVETQIKSATSIGEVLRLQRAASGATL